MELLPRLLKWFLGRRCGSGSRLRRPFVPRAVRARAEAMAEFASLHSRLIEILHSARTGWPTGQLNFGRPSFAPSLQRLLCVSIIAAHERRHLWQAEQAVEELRRRLGRA